MTDVQQAVPVAQEDIEFAEKFGNLWLEGSTVAKMALAHQVALHRHRLASLPCKSGEEGAGEREAIARIIDEYPFNNRARDSLASQEREKIAYRKADAIRALTPDATQTREAELVAAAQEAHDALHECTAVLTASDCKKVAATMTRLRVALNARGGA